MNGNGTAPVVLGGIDDQGDNITTVEVFVDGYKSCCNLIPKIPVNIAYENRAAATVAAKIYGCGGEETDTKAPTSNCMFLNVLDKAHYEWKSSPSDIPPMQDKRTSAAAVGAYGELYIFGGSNVALPNVYLLSSVSIYNPEIKRWRFLDSSMPHARAGHCAVLLKDVVYIIGGKTTESASTRKAVFLSIDTYNITSKVWSKTFSLEGYGIENRKDHACTFHHNSILISGGSSGTDWTDVLSSVIAINVNPGEGYMSVTKLPNLNQSRMSHGMTIYKDKPYVMGGHGTSDKHIDVNEMLINNGGGSGWTENGELQSARIHFSLTELSTNLLPDEGAECTS